MTWSYSENPSFSEKDEVRFYIGDTDSSDQQLSNEEIEWAITQATSTRGAGAICARALASKYARLSDIAIGDLRQAYSQRQDHYTDMAKRLDALEARRGITSIYAGGISESDKESVKENTDRVTPNFSIGMHDNPGSETDSEDVCR